MADQALEDPAHQRYAEQQITRLLDDLDDLRRSIELASHALDLA